MDDSTEDEYPVKYGSRLMHQYDYQNALDYSVKIAVKKAFGEEFTKALQIEK